MRLISYNNNVNNFKQRKGKNKMMTITPNATYIMIVKAVADGLDEQDIPYSTNYIWDGYQIRFPWCSGDVVCHSGSYGHANGMVESYGFPWDTDNEFLGVTPLTVAEAIEKIANYYSEVNANEC